MSEKYILRNYMLEFLDYYIPIYIREHPAEFGSHADSPKFRRQFLLSALNRLPSKYVTSPSGEVFSNCQLKLPQSNADITSALTLARIEAIEKMSGSV